MSSSWKIRLGTAVCGLGLLFGLGVFLRERAQPAHASMKAVGTLIVETCKSYLLQQGNFLIVLGKGGKPCVLF